MNVAQAITGALRATGYFRIPEGLDGGKLEITESIKLPSYCLLEGDGRGSRIHCLGAFPAFVFLNPDGSASVNAKIRGVRETRDGDLLTGDVAYEITTTTLHARDLWLTTSARATAYAAGTFEPPVTVPATPSRVVFPIGTGVDDWAQLRAAMDAMAYVGTVYMAAGTWQCKTKQVTPSGTTLYMSAGVTVISSLAPNAPGVALDACPFYNSSGTAGHGGASVPKLSANANAGSKTITITESVPVGSEIVVGDWVSLALNNVEATGRMTRRVTARAGNVLTLDRPLTRAAKVNDECLKIGFDPVRNVRIFGNGATFSGTGDQVVELLSPVDCHVSGIRVSGEWQGVAALTMDLGHRDSGFSDCVVDGKGTLPGAYGIIGGENGWLDRCDSRATTAWAVGLLSSFNPRIYGGIHSGGTASPIGLYVGVDGPGAKGGTRGALIEGVALLGFTKGMQISDGAQSIRLVGVEASNCSHGFFVGLGATNVAPKDVTVSGGIARGNATAIFVEGAGIEVAVAELAIDDCTSNSVVASGGSRVDLAAVKLRESVAHAGLQGILYATGANSLITIDGVVAVCTQAGAGNSAQFVQIENGGALRSSGRKSTCAFNGAGLDYVTGVYLGASGNAEVDDLAISGTGGTVGTYGVNASGAATWARIGDDVNLDLAGANRLVGAGSFNRGEATLSGAPTKAVAFAGTRASDQFRWTRKTAGGTPSDVTSGAPSVGVGFTLGCSAADTSTLAYVIG